MSPHLDALKTSLQMLAQPASLQISLSDPRVAIADELALDFEHALAVVTSNGLLARAALDKLDEIDNLLATHSGEDKAEHWTEAALSHDPLWQRVRGMAAEALETLGWPNEPPLA